MNYYNTQHKHLFLIALALGFFQLSVYSIILSSKNVILDSFNLTLLTSLGVLCALVAYWGYSYFKNRLLLADVHIIAHPELDSKVSELFQAHNISDGHFKDNLISIIGNEHISFRFDKNHVFVTFTTYDNLDYDSTNVHDYIISIIKKNM